MAGKRKTRKLHSKDIPFVLSKRQRALLSAVAAFPLKSDPVLDAVSFFEYCRSPFPVKKEKRNSAKSKDKGEVCYTAYRFRGYPDKEQAYRLSMFCGSTRFLWNRMVFDRKADLEDGRFPEIHKPAYYKKQEGMEWLSEMDSYALCNVQLDFESAVSDAKSNGNGKGYPRPHKKHKRADSYTTNRDSRCNNVSFDGKFLVLPKIPGKVRIMAHRNIKPGGMLKKCTVIHEPDGNWYFSLLYEYPEEEFKFCPGIEEFLATGDIDAIRHTGLDMSLPSLFVMPDGSTPAYVNDGVTIAFEKQYRKLEGRIAREQQKLSHMQKDSSNYSKQLRKIAKLHAKAKHQRNDFLHQVSRRLVGSFDIISIEDLDIAGMKKALKFGKSVSDNGWSCFVGMLQYKANASGKLVIKINKWFPSTKTCSCCGHVHKEITLSDRTYICPACGNITGRDEQAAGNIDLEGLREFAEAYKAFAA